MTVAAAEAAVGLAHRHRAVPAQGNAHPGRVHVAEVVTACSALIPLLPFARLPVNATSRPAAAEERRRAPSPPARWSLSFGVSAVAPSGDLLAVAPVGGVRAIERDASSRGSRRARCRCRFAFRLDPLVVGDDPRHHRHRHADPPVLDGVHARGVGRRVRALLLVPEPVRRVHARAGARRELPGDVHRLGRRRPLLVPADRLLVHEAVGRRRRQEGVHRQPHRRLRLHPRHARAVRRRSARSTSRALREQVGRAAAPRRAGAASSPAPRCCCSSAPPASPRRFRSTSGCRTRWKARRRSPR